MRAGLQKLILLSVDELFLSEHDSCALASMGESFYRMRVLLLFVLLYLWSTVRKQLEFLFCFKCLVWKMF